MMIATAASTTTAGVVDVARRYSVVVADPDAGTRRRIVELISNHPDFEVAAECRTGPEAVDAVRRYRPQLMIVDVNTPQMDGFGVVCELRDELPESVAPAVIFLTANEVYAIRAFELRAVDCMMRPFGPDRMLAALQRAKMFVVQREMEDVQYRLQGILSILGEGNADAQAQHRLRGADDLIRRIGVRSGDRWLVVHAPEIDWIGGAGVYAKIAVGKETYLLRSSLLELERRLDPSRFVRIHRSTIVNITRVSEVRLHGHGEYLLVLGHGTELRASRSYADRVRDAIDKLG